MADDIAPFGFGALPEYDPVTGTIIPTPAQQAKFNRAADAVTGAFKLAGSPSAPSEAAPFGMSGTPEDYYVPEGEAPNKTRRILGAIGSGLRNWVETPGRAMRDGITTEDATDWAAPTAFGMVAGARLPGGAVGSGMTRLKQPEIPSDIPLSISPGIRAYHGSPYDFEKFDTAKIGTGEGAQAYGHGLYFAEAEQTARTYRDALSKSQKGEWSVNGQSLESLPDNLRRVAFNHIYAGNTLKGTPLEGAAIDLKPPGRMYEVNIGAKPEQFLDWDKKARDMPSDVQAKLSRLGFNISGPDQGLIGSQIVNRGIDAGGGAVASRTFNEAGIPGIRYLDQGSRGPANWTGKPDAQATAKYKDQWESLVADRRKAAGENQRGDTSHVDAMMDSVHKKMMDETMARDPNAGRTSNYVVFSPEIIQILRKYALPGAVGGGAAFGSLAPGDQ